MIFEEIKFPIQGPLRELLLIMESLIVLLFFEIAVIFYIRVKKQEIKKEPNQQEKGYVMMFLGYSIMWIFCILGDYTAETRIIRSIFLSIGFFIMMFCGLIYLYRMEKSQIFIKKFLFSKIFTVIILLIFISVLSGIESPQILAFLSFYTIFYLFMILYLIKFVSNPYIKRIQKNYKLMILSLSVGFTFLGLGFFFTTEYILTYFGLISRVIGDIIQLIGFVLICIFFLTVPSLEEYEWRKKIDKLFLILKSGICIYYKVFKDELTQFDEQVTSAIVKSINDILKELTENKGISIIERTHKIFIIHPGKFITGVLICDEELNALKVLLNKFIENIEEIYSKIIEEWNFEVKIFEPIEAMAKEVFLF
ncbi:MAG: hypothetical protein ACFFHV_23630 [Promethearchaeota archaeon]